MFAQWQSDTASRISNPIPCSTPVGITRGQVTDKLPTGTLFFFPLADRFRTPEASFKRLEDKKANRVTELVLIGVKDLFSSPLMSISRDDLIN